jgi:hypothetical protein
MAMVGMPTHRSNDAHEGVNIMTQQPENTPAPAELDPAELDETRPDSDEPAGDDAPAPEADESGEPIDTDENDETKDTDAK